MMEHAVDLTDASKEHGGEREAPKVAKLLFMLENDISELYILVFHHFTKGTAYDSVLTSVPLRPAQI